MSTDPKYMDLNEFQKLGFVQEINRLVLHPAGLAISVEVDDTGKVLGFGPVYDYREDKEGMIFNDLNSITARQKADTVKSVQEAHREHREKNLGYFVQPIPTSSE